MAEVKEILQSGELNIYYLEDGESDRYVRTRRAGEVVVGGVNAGGESRGSENNLEFGEDELVFAKHEALGVLGMFEAKAGAASVYFDIGVLVLLPRCSCTGRKVSRPQGAADVAL